MEAPKIVLDLVERFDMHRDAYKSPEYNETQTRREFIDPLFEAMGWDVNNLQNFSEQFKHVVHEDAIRIGGITKAPDYSFRLGGRRIFFLEAKKPAVNIKDDPAPAYQLRRYAWTAKMPVSILTDFEDFIVYDTRVKPSETDKASTARVLCIPYSEYAQRWDEIVALFSPEAIQRGALEKFVASTTKKRGTAEVDDEFLAEIEEWRDLLARNVALRNPGISQRDLNFAVQTTIDRIVFLRICEDRGIEPYAQLMALLSGGDTYARLRVLYERADERYNSGLFHFHKERGRAGEPDTLTPKLTMDDKALKTILERLYYPKCPYEFSVFPAEILGQVYERFLGSVIRLTAGGQAKVEQKPEVRKAGGVYYTPGYIVDYIVKHTVGALLEGKTPQEVAGLTETWRPAKNGRPIAILDPACGSGSFLLGAYQYLLDWHLDYYRDDTKKWSTGKEPRIYQDARGEWRLTTAERKRILLANIYGVDIDTQAVEVTKLSLLLRVLEGENGETLDKQFRLFHERALPDLACNIKCGNSLIGPDFHQGRQTEFDVEEAYRVNAFDWDAEFPAIVKSGGFDAAIGNPPYVRIQTLKEWTPDEVEYYKQRYRSAASGNYDLYVVFIEKGLRLLNAAGHLGFICPHKFFNAKYGECLRKLIAEGKHLESIVHFGDCQVFSNATTYTCLLFLQKNATAAFDIVRVTDIDTWREMNDVQPTAFTLPSPDRDAKTWNFSIVSNSSLLERLKAGRVPLNEAATIFVGLQTSADRAFIVPLDADIEQEITKPFLYTGSLCAYAPAHPSARLIFPYSLHLGEASLIPSKTLKNDFPKAWNHLWAHRETLMGRDRGKWPREFWYAFGRTQNLTQMDGKKLVIQVTAQQPTVLLDERGLYMTGGGSGPFYGIRPKTSALSFEYLLGILNSRLFGWIVKSQSTNLRGGYIKFSKQYIESVPIAIADSKARHDKMVALVQRMLDLHNRLRMANNNHARAVLERQIAATNKEIDKLVYEIYDLTEEEIAIVET